MSHVVLLGDSIFDNGSYVPGEPAVINQLRSILPSGWKATLLAVDGDVTADVSTQLHRLPDDATHLVISTGGNDALGASAVLQQPVRTVREALHAIHDVRESFRNRYRTMLEAVRSKGKRVAICTVYDSVPGLGPAEASALAGFNEIILREAFALRFPVIDLRLVCDQSADYSSLSPIEPSACGGAKIVQRIVTFVTSPESNHRRSEVFA